MWLWFESVSGTILVKPYGLLNLFLIPLFIRTMCVLSSGAARKMRIPIKLFSTALKCLLKLKSWPIHLYFRRSAAHPSNKFWSLSSSFWKNSSVLDFFTIFFPCDAFSTLHRPQFHCYTRISSFGAGITIESSSLSAQAAALPPQSS